jgi:hypothetical protein
MKKYTILKLKLFFLLAIILTAACKYEKKSQPVTRHTTQDHKTKTKPHGNFPDTLKITETAAVFYYPDSLQLEKIKAETDSNIFKSSMHEYFYQMRNARIVLKKILPEIKIIDAKNVRYLLFTYNDNKTGYIDLDAKNDAYGLILFNRQKPPLIADMANIESEAGLYFAK